MDDHLNTVLGLKDEKKEPVGPEPTSKTPALIKTIGYLEIIAGLIIGFILGYREVILIDYFLRIFNGQQPLHGG